MVPTMIRGAGVFALLLSVCVRAEGAGGKKLNILMIGVDDLRPDIAGPSFGQSQVRTPNLERLAKQGTAFQRAYCQVRIRPAFSCGCPRGRL